MFVDKNWATLSAPERGQAKVRPIIANYSRLSENFGRAIEASLLGKKTPEQALKESQKRLELVFQD